MKKKTPITAVAADPTGLKAMSDKEHEGSDILLFLVSAM